MMIKHTMQKPKKNIPQVMEVSKKCKACTNQLTPTIENTNEKRCKKSPQTK
jgi:hypothetical protein